VGEPVDRRAGQRRRRGSQHEDRGAQRDGAPGQNDDVQRETQTQSAGLGAQDEAARQAWAKLTPEQKKAATRVAWQE